MDFLQKQRTIQFNYDEAMRRAKELDEIAGELDRAKSGLKDALQPLRNAWEGESANSYQRKGEELQNQIRDSAKEVRSSAEEVRRVANRIRALELTNLEIARRREH